MLFIASNPIFDSFFHSDLFGKAIFFGLLILSLMTWFVFLSKWRYSREIRKKSPAIREAFLRRWQNPLSVEIEPSFHPYSRLFHHLKQETHELTLKKAEEKKTLSPNEVAMLEESLMFATDREIKHFEKNLFLLSTVVTLAPFMGLLGTVWGILLTFSELQKGAVSNANSMVMNGLAMALGTTVVGLLVAIPALLSYNWLKSAIGLFAADVDDFARILLKSVARHFQKSEEKPF